MNVCLDTGRLIKVYAELGSVHKVYTDKLGDNHALLDEMIQRLNVIRKDYRGGDPLPFDQETRDRIAGELKYLRKHMALPALTRCKLEEV